MKRIALFALFIITAFLVALFRPELVSTTNVLVAAVVALIILVISLVRNPVTEYITKTEWQTIEMKTATTFRHGINFFRDKQVSFHMSNGEVIYGVLVGRSDYAGTYTIETSTEHYETIPQAALLKVGAVGKENMPKTLLDWDDTSPLLVPRSCS